MKGTQHRRTVKRFQHAREQQKRRYNDRATCRRQYARVLENDCSPNTPEAKALYEFLPQLASADGGNENSPYCFMYQTMKYVAPPAPSHVKRKKDVYPLSSPHVNPTHLMKRLTSEVRGLVNALSTGTLADKVRSLGLPSESQTEVETAVKQIPTMRSKKYNSVADCIDSGSRNYESMVRALTPIIKHLLQIPKFKGGKSDPAGILQAVMRRLKFKKRLVWIYHIFYIQSQNIHSTTTHRHFLCRSLASEHHHFDKDSGVGKIIESWRSAMREENRSLSKQLLGIVLATLPKGKMR